MNAPRRGLQIPLVALLVPLFFVALSPIATGQVYVANSLSGTVAVISTLSNTVVATIPVGNLPQRVAITPNGRFAYVTNQNSGTVSKIDTTSNLVVATLSVGGAPRAVAVSPDGDSVFVVVAGSLVKFSVATDVAVRTFPLPIGDPIDVAITPSGQFAYVVDKNQNVCSLYPIDLTTADLLTSTQCAGPPFSTIGAVGGSFPRGVAVRPDGQFVYVTAFQDGALQTVRVTDNVRTGGGCVSSFGCPFGGPIGVAVSADSKFAFTANSNENSVAIFPLDLASGNPSSLPIKVPLTSNPSYLSVTPDGRFLYVTHGSNSVSVVDLRAAPPSVIQTIAVGSFPLGIAVSPLASFGPSPPALSATLAASPATVTIGQSIIVTMTVTNTGGSAATGVTASPLSTSGSGSAILTNGPSPSPTTIGAGGSQVFTYTYSASAAGTMTLSGSASGGGVTSNLATSNVVTIQAPQLPPTLSVAPASVSFTGEQGLADPASQALSIGNAGSGTLAWSATAATADGGNWLSPRSAAGSVPPTTSILVSANTCGLMASTYSGSITVSSAGASNSPRSISVTLTVTSPTGKPSAPHLSVCADRPAYHTGNTLHLSTSIRQGAASNTGDAYLFAQVPGTAGFVSLVLSQNGIVPVFAPAPVPFARNFSIFDFVGEFFARPFDGGEPEGVYTVTGVLAISNSDPLISADQIAAGTCTFSFSH